VGRERRADDDGLVAVEDEAGAVFLRRGGNIVEIEAGFRFGIGEGENRLAADEAGDVFFLLRCRSAMAQEVAADDDGLQVRAR